MCRTMLLDMTAYSHDAKRIRGDRRVPVATPSTTNVISSLDRTVPRSAKSASKCAVHCIRFPADTPEKFPRLTSPVWPAGPSRRPPAEPGNSCHRQTPYHPTLDPDPWHISASVPLAAASADLVCPCFQPPVTSIPAHTSTRHSRPSPVYVLELGPIALPTRLIG